MTVIASCGHDITEKESFNLTIMDWARTGERATYFGVFCLPCKEMYEEYGLVLDTLEDENKWFNGEIDYPEFDWDKQEII